MMRTIKRLILTCMMSLFFLNINAQKSEAYDWTRVMNAIIQVESKGNPNAHNPSSDCAGILQMTKIAVRECNQILQRKKSDKRYTYQDRYDAEKSKEMFILLQEHFNSEHDIEKAIKCWNCGFYTKSWRKCSIDYHKRVMEHYDKNNGEE